MDPSQAQPLPSCKRTSENVILNGGSGTVSPSSVVKGGSYQAAMSGLVAGTVYTVTVRAVNSAGQQADNSVSFTTSE